MNRTLIIGSRGSKLALFQAEQAKALLLEANPTLEVRIEIIKTTGDVKSDPLTAIGGKGVFTKELEDALMDRRIDIAVHSLKDLPTIVPPELTIGAVCEREDPRDALVLRPDLVTSSGTLDGLPQEAIVGTSSQRRFTQLRALRADVVIKDLRGNVDTRLRKLDEGQYEALILAAAGLRRLGLSDRITTAISPEHMLPAVGQGAVGIEVRRDDDAALEAVTPLDHESTRIACLAERSFLRALGGGCQLPIAAHAVLDQRELKVDGLVASADGTQIVRDKISGNSTDAELLGNKLAEHLISMGADSLLDNA
ncbi:MAG TPA: hydroxymethylbilane synthase [Pyrinomonadaceae bacterium]|nr:hydroxymethylbilane synthase [Pyrinomonadaceae bacterium]